MGHPRASFSFFQSFRINIVTIFITNQSEKISCTSRLPSWDSNPRPPEHESSPITTRPGLPPYKVLPSSRHISKMLLLLRLNLARRWSMRVDNENENE